MMFESPGNCMTDLSSLPLYLKGPWVTTAGSHTLRPSYEAIRMARRYIPHQMADLLHLHAAGQLTLFSRRPLLIPFRNTLEQRNTLSTFWEVSLGNLELSSAERSAAALLQTSSSLSNGGNNTVHANANCFPPKFLESTENNFSKWSF